MLYIGIMKSNTSLINKPAIMYVRNTWLVKYVDGFACSNSAANVIELINIYAFHETAFSEIVFRLISGSVADTN